MKKYITIIIYILILSFFLNAQDLLEKPIPIENANIEGIYIFRIPEIIIGDGILIEKIDTGYSFKSINFQTGPDLEIKDLSQFRIFENFQSITPSENMFSVPSNQSTQILYPYNKGLVGYLLLEDGSRWYDLKLIKIPGNFRNLIVMPSGQRMHGDDVVFLQKFLINSGYNIGDSGIDSYYGPDTEKAVIQFKKDNSLRENGTVDPEVWYKIFELGID